MSVSLGKRPEIVGHGGAAGFFESNSAASIEKALALDVDRVEVDVQTSADGQLILFHDTEITISGKAVPVSLLTLDDIQSLHPDVITLAEGYDIVAGQKPLMLDIKARGSEAKLAAAIRSMRTDDDVSASSTHARTLRILRHEFPKMKLALSRGHSLTKLPGSDLQHMGGRTIAAGQLWMQRAILRVIGANQVSLHHHLCQPGLVRSLQANDVYVNAWTVDRPREIERMLRVGVDAIISNRPDIVQELVESRFGPDRDPST